MKFFAILSAFSKSFLADRSPKIPLLKLLPDLILPFYFQAISRRTGNFIAKPCKFLRPPSSASFFPARSVSVGRCGFPTAKKELAHREHCSSADLVHYLVVNPHEKYDRHPHIEDEELRLL
jgi:hypothetical protein